MLGVFKISKKLHGKDNTVNWNVLTGNLKYEILVYSLVFFSSGAWSNFDHQYAKSYFRVKYWFNLSLGNNKSAYTCMYVDMSL